MNVHMQLTRMALQVNCHWMRSLTELWSVIRASIETGLRTILCKYICPYDRSTDIRQWNCDRRNLASETTIVHQSWPAADAYADAKHIDVDDIPQYKCIAMLDLILDREMAIKIERTFPMVL